MSNDGLLVDGQVAGFSRKLQLQSKRHHWRESAKIRKSFVPDTNAWHQQQHIVDVDHQKSEGGVLSVFNYTPRLGFGGTLFRT
eukprot:2639128-Pyramimonas_sp.AAC.1